MVSRLLGRCYEGKPSLPPGFINDAQKISKMLSPPNAKAKATTSAQASSNSIQPAFVLGDRHPYPTTDPNHIERTPLQTWKWHTDDTLTITCDILPDTALHNPTEAEYNRLLEKMDTSCMELWMHKLYSECSSTFSRRCIALTIIGKDVNYQVFATTQELKDKMQYPFWIEDSVTQCTESWLDQESLQGEAGMNSKICRSYPLIFRQNVRVGVQANENNITSVDMLNRLVQLQIGTAKLFMRRRTTTEGGQATEDLPRFASIDVESTAFKSMKYTVPAGLSINMAVLLSRVKVTIRDGAAATLQIKTTYVLNDRRHKGHEYRPTALPAGEHRVEQHSLSWPPLLKPATAGTSNFTFAGIPGSDAMEHNTPGRMVIHYRDADTSRTSTSKWAGNLLEEWEQHAKEASRRYRESMRGVVGRSVAGNTKKGAQNPIAGPDNGMSSGKKELRVGFRKASSGTGTRTKPPPQPLVSSAVGGSIHGRKGNKARDAGARKTPLHIALLGLLSQVISSSGFTENRGGSNNQLLESLAKRISASPAPSQGQRAFPFLYLSASARSCASVSPEKFLASHVLGTECTAF